MEISYEEFRKVKIHVRTVKAVKKIKGFANLHWHWK